MLKRVLDPCGIIRVQTWGSQSAAPSTVEQTLGVAWPQQIGAIASGRADILCTGPTDWLVVVIESDVSALLKRLDVAFDGSSFRATNVSQALARVEIDGRDARKLLSKGCALDLHPHCFPPGLCARTRFAGMPVIIRCTRYWTFECIVSLSYTDYFLSWLNDAALEFGAVS
jgi:sarcosine oxidase subunit gamma